MSSKVSLSVKIYLFDLADKDVIACKWQTLEKRANNSVFLSWAWIGNWLDFVDGKLFIVECYNDNCLVGLAFFVEKYRKVLGLYPIKQWYLHRTGCIQQDQIWIEHNDFLLDASISSSVRECMTHEIFNYDNSIKEFVIGLSTHEVLDSFSLEFCNTRILLSTQGYIVNTKSINESYLLDVLSKNTRSQIKRSEKILTQQGNVSFYVVSNAEQVKKLLADIAKIHIIRWQNTPEGSGFTNPQFCSFHDKLASNLEDDFVEISVLSLNNTAIGYLLNFRYKDHVSFYLSALSLFDNSKIKVGLMLHARAIQYYVNLGIKNYDFIGGDARYKQSLSNNRYNLGLICYYRPSLLLQLESKLRVIKGRLTE